MYIILQKSGETEPIIITYSSVFFCLNTLFRDATKEQSERGARKQSSNLSKFNFRKFTVHKAGTRGVESRSAPPDGNQVNRRNSQRGWGFDIFSG